MARFIGYLQGTRGEASRLGTPSSGIRATAQGWNSGVTVYGDVVPVSDGSEADEFVIIVHGGSNGGGRRETIATVIGLNGEVMVTIPAWLSAKLGGAEREVTVSL